MLDGFDKDWTEAGSRRTAYYTNIPPGDYSFKVVAKNADGIESRQAAAVSFVLPKHFYQTAAFFCLEGMFIVGPFGGRL